MKKLSIVLLFPLLAAAADGRPAAVVAMVDRARSAPSEFSADALLRIAALDTLDKAWRAELYEEAYRRAANAHAPLKLHPALFRRDGPSVFLERAWGQNLDAQSLQMRAIEGLLTVAPAKARELFTDLQPPHLPKLDCKELMVPDVSMFYATLTRIANETYSADEVKKEEPFKLLARYVAIESPVQLGPVAHLLVEAKLSDGQFQDLLAHFAASLKTISGDDRSFSTTKPASLQVKELVDTIAKRGGSPIGFLEAYRVYLVHHMGGVRCADNTRATSTPAITTVDSMDKKLEELQSIANPANYFNDVLLRGRHLPKITAEEGTQSKSEGEAEGMEACDSVECKAIGKDYSALIFKNPTTPYTQQEMSEPEGQARLRQFLESMANWKQDTGSTPLQHFRYKCDLYGLLQAVTPASAGREAVLTATLEYLQSARNQFDNSIEWVLPVNVLISRVTMDPTGLKLLGEQLRASGDPVIALYANLELVAPRGLDKIIGLL